MQADKRARGEGGAPIELTPEEARQGRRGLPVLKVLAASLGLCVVVFVLYWVFA